MGARVVLESGSEISENADCLLLALLDGEDGFELVAPKCRRQRSTRDSRGPGGYGAKAKLESVTRIPAPAGLKSSDNTGNSDENGAGK